MNWVPSESLVDFCSQVPGYSTEKPFDVHVVSHHAKPASGVGVIVGTGDGEGVGESVGESVGLGTRVGVVMLVGEAF